MRVDTSAELYMDDSISLCSVDIDELVVIQHEGEDKRL
jgi:hypothetical protein